MGAGFDRHRQDVGDGQHLLVDGNPSDLTRDSAIAPGAYTWKATDAGAT